MITAKGFASTRFVKQSIATTRNLICFLPGGKGPRCQPPMLRMVVVMKCLSCVLLGCAAHFQTIDTCRIFERLGLHLSTWSARNILLELLYPRVIVDLSDFRRFFRGSHLAYMQHLQNRGTSSRARKTPFCKARYSGS